MKEQSLDAIFKTTHGRCHFCGDKIKRGNIGWAPTMDGHWEADHVFQHAKGGKSNPDNFLPACTRCNRLRWHRTGHALRELLLMGLIAADEIGKQNSVGRSLQSLRRLRLEKNAIRRKENALKRDLELQRISEQLFKTRVAKLHRGRTELRRLEQKWLDGDLSYGRLMSNKAEERRQMGIVQPTKADVIASPSKGKT